MRRKSNRQKMYYFSEKLKKQLSKIPEYPLTVVEAPSGFGKSTAIREYLNRTCSEEVPQYWYTCLGESGTVTWKGICQLLAGIHAETAMLLKKIKMPACDTLPYIMTSLRSLQCSREIYLVIDNYQLMSSNVPRELISLFSMHGCPQLHIIFITQPLEARQFFTFHGHNIHKIDSTALTFDRKGTDRLFRLEGIRLSAHELEYVSANTEGWVAAIRLQILNYQENRAFYYTQRMEQLVDTAVWNHLTADEKDFLISVSIMDTFSARQAAIMLQQETLPDYIDELLRSSGFINYYPDKGIYVIHHILQEFLRNRFYYHKSKNFQSQITLLAGTSFATANDYCRAWVLFYKEKAFNSILTLPLTGEYIVNQKESYDFNLLTEFIECCPKEILIKYPFQLLMYAYQMLLLDKKQSYRKLCCLISGIIHTNTELDPEEISRLQGEYLFMKTCTEFSDINKRIKGFREAKRMLKASSSILTKHSSWPCGCSILSLFWCKSGELENIYEKVDESALLYRHLTGGHMRGAESIMRAESMLMQGNDIEAEILCHKALYDASSFQQAGIYLCADLVLARIAILRGDTEGYFIALNKLKLHAADSTRTHIFRTAELCLAFISMVLKIPDYVPAWFNQLEDIEKILYPAAASVARTIYAKKLLLDKKYTPFYGFSQYVMEQNESFLMPQLYNQIFLSIANYYGGREQEAQQHLKQALALSLPDKIYLPFAEHIEELDPLLEAAKSYVTDRVRLMELLTVCKRQEKGSTLIKKTLHSYQSPLTPREKEIALLAKDRLSAREIAGKLYLSETTVRTVLRNIYSKLDIHSKAELSSKKF